MQDLERYLNEIIAPTIAEFEHSPVSTRLAFLACVAVAHAVDYMAYPKNNKRGLLQQWCTESYAFSKADIVAHAFKHVRGDRGRVTLLAKDVISRPPAVAGSLVPNLSIVGDTVGAVTLASDVQLNLLEIVKEAAAFLRSKTRG